MSDQLYKKILVQLSILVQDNKQQSAKLDDIHKRLKRLEGTR